MRRSLFNFEGKEVLSRVSIHEISGSDHNNLEKIRDSQTLKKNEGVKGKFVTSKEDSRLKKVPDTREEKVRDVKARIESGFYDKKENITKVANSINEAGLRPLGS